MAKKKPKNNKPLSPEQERLRAACAAAAGEGNWPAVLELSQRHANLAARDSLVNLYLLRALEGLQMTSQLVQRAEMGVAAHPRDPRFLSWLSHARRLAGDVEGAVDPLRRAVKLAGANSQLFNSLGSALKETGDFDEARQWLEKAIKLDRRNLKAWWNLSDLDNQHQKAIDQLLPLLQGADRLNEPELLHFSLFRHYDKLDDTDKAFAQLQLANQRRFERFRPNAAAERVLTDRILHFFGGMDFSALTQECRGDSCLFVFGLARSGTTLTEQIIATHGQVQGGNELSALSNAGAHVRADNGLSGEFPDWLGQLDASGWQKIGRHYLNLTAELKKDSNYLTDKSLLNYRAAGLIRCALPGARMVQVYRNPADQAFALYKQNFSDGIRFSYHFDTIASALADHQRLLTLWQEKLDSSHYRAQSYEALVRNPNDQIPALIAHCGLDWDPACLQPHLNRRTVRTLSATQVRRPISTANIDSWQRYQRHLQPMFDALEKYRLL